MSSAKGTVTQTLDPPRVPEARPGPPGGARDANRRRKVEQLCDAALELFLARGVAEVTVDEVVQRAIIPKGSFYRYFRDLEDLVDTLLRPLADDFRAALDACAAKLDKASPHDDDHSSSPYMELAAALGLAASNHRDVVRLFLQESRAPAIGARRPIRLLADEMTARGVALAMAGRRLGWFREIDPRLVTHIIIGAAERIFFEHLADATLGSDIHVSTALVTVMIWGLKRYRD